jgi:hypothetical protein
VKILPFPMDESQLESQLNDLQTDENELDEVLAKYDLDEALEAEFNDLEKSISQPTASLPNLTQHKEIFE